jgi:hypothetical protein
MDLIDFAPFIPLAAILVSIAASLLLIVNEYRLSIVLLAFLYVGVFVMVAESWPLTLAVIKLIAGWIAAAVLSLAINSAPEVRQSLQNEDFYLHPLDQPYTTRSTAQNRLLSQTTRKGISKIFAYILFCSIAAIIVGIGVWSNTPSLAQWLPSQSGISNLNFFTAGAGMALIGFGLLKLGLNAHTFPTIISLLIALSGFEIIYAQVQSSALVAGLLAGLQLALALVGAYLLLAPFMEEQA